MYEHLYKNADLKHLTPNIPWAASSVLLSLQNVNCWVNLFPTASEMYDQYDYWPKSSNPFSNGNSHFHHPNSDVDDVSTTLTKMNNLIKSVSNNKRSYLTKSQQAEL